MFCDLKFAGVGMVQCREHSPYNIQGPGSNPGLICECFFISRFFCRFFSFPPSTKATLFSKLQFDVDTMDEEPSVDMP